MVRILPIKDGSQMVNSYKVFYLTANEKVIPETYELGFTWVFLPTIQKRSGSNK